MSRMSDMAQTIEELRSAAAAISDAVDWLTKVFSSEPQAEDAPASPPEPELTLEQVRAMLADKSRQGHTAEIRACQHGLRDARAIKQCAFQFGVCKIGAIH